MALEVSAAIIGILAAGGKVVELLGPVVSAFAHAPQHAKTILTEVRYTRTILLGLQTLFDELVAVPRRRKELIQIDQLIAALTDGVLLFSELEALVDSLGDPQDRVLNRAKWVQREKEITSVVSRLLGFKTSVALMLGILRCESDLVAQFDRQQLLANTAKILQNNLDLSQRLAHLEHCLDASQSAITNRPSSCASMAITPPTPTNVETGSGLTALKHYFTDLARMTHFERDLATSRVYRKVRQHSCDVSFHSSIAASHAWSALSELSLSDISAISVVGLPLSSDNIANAYHYKFENLSPGVSPLSGLLNSSLANDIFEETCSLNSHQDFSRTITSMAEEELSEESSSSKFVPRSTRLKLVIMGTPNSDVYDLVTKLPGKSEEISYTMSDILCSTTRDCTVEGLSIHLDIEVSHKPLGLTVEENLPEGDMYLLVYNTHFDNDYAYMYFYMNLVRHFKDTNSLTNSLPILMLAKHEGQLFNAYFYEREPEGPYGSMKKDEISIQGAINRLVRERWEFEEIAKANGENIFTVGLRALLQ